MLTRRTLIPGQIGAKKFLKRYGGQLVYVRYRYDKQQRKHGAEVKIIIEESGLSPPEKPEIVGLRSNPRKPNRSVASNRR